MRTERGLSLEALARQVGMHKGRLSRLERGLTGTSVDRLRRLAKALGVEAASLLGAETVR